MPRSRPHVFFLTGRCGLRLLSVASLGAWVACNAFGQSVGSDVYRKKAGPPKVALTLSPPGVMASLPAPPRVDFSVLSAAELPPVNAGFGPDRIGLHRKLPPGVWSGVGSKASAAGAPTGGWTVLAGGNSVWRMALRSTGARGVRVHFEGFDAGDGHVWVYAEDKNLADWSGHYQRRGPHGDGDFWSDLIFSDSVVIEFLPGPSAGWEQTVPFRITEISHLWRDIGSPPPTQSQGRSLFPGAGFTPPQQNQAASCSLDVSCFPQWADTTHAVARILFETSGGSALCTGTLLNDFGDANPAYFLTAAHCISDQSAARSLIAFWSYQTSTCNGQPPNVNSVPRTLGSTLLVTQGGGAARDPKGDYTLLLLNDAPDNALLSGWDARGTGAGLAVAGIHHPRGDYKRITLGETIQEPSIPGLYLPVAESQGRTQNGSSGSGLFSEPGVLVGSLSFGPKPAPGETECDMSPGFGVYQRLSDAYADLQPFLESDVAPPLPDEDPPGGDLSLGGTDTFTLDPVDGPTLFTDDFAYIVDAPSDVTRITISLEALNPPGVDIDLYVRFGETPNVSGGGVLAEYASEGPAGTEEIIIDANSNPPLRAGSYFIGIGAFTPNTAIEARIQVTIERSTPTAPPVGTELTSNQPVNFTLPAVNAATLFAENSSYRIQVPQGASRLDVAISTATQGADVDLYVRFGQPPDVQGGQVVADASSISFSGDELVTLTAADGLRAGTYFIALALYSTGVSARGTIEASVASGAGNLPGIPISAGSPQNFAVQAVDGPTFFTDLIYRVEVGENVARLLVDLETTTPNVDVDLYVRYGAPPEVSGGSVLATFTSEGLTGREQVVISAASSPPLRPGTYFIGLALFTAGQPASGRVRVTLEQRAAGGPRINAAVGAAGFLAGPIAPGQIISLFGVDMGPSVGIGARLDPVTGRLATSLGGVRVLFDSVSAPLFFARGDQINVQVPYGVAGRPSTNIAITFNDQLSNALSVPVAQTAPGLFMVGDGTNRVVALNQDGSINSPANPARRGDVVVLFATGEGLTNPAARDGALAPNAEPLQRPLLPVETSFGGSPGEIVFAGSAPGFAGLLQVNVKIAAGAPAGNEVLVQLKVGGNASQPGATISIQ